MFIKPAELYSSERLQAAKVCVRGVSKRFGEGEASVQALDCIDAVIQPNDFLCVVGPSGCGKSTLLNILAGFEPPTDGEVLMDGVPISGPAAERGVVFQQGALFTWMTVFNNIAFGPMCCGKSRSEAREIARYYIDLVNLTKFENRYPYELSGGMQQRVGIARALANDPDILLMDEPFAALDQQTRELLQEEIKRIWEKTHKTILWITHSIEEALFLATHVLAMTARPGRVKAGFETGFSDAKDHLVTTSVEFTNAKRVIFELLREESIIAETQKDKIDD